MENIKISRKNKDSQKHHHNKKLSVDKMNTKFLNFMKKVEISKNTQIKKDKKLDAINKSNIKEEGKTERISDQKKYLKRNGSTIISSKIEKDYIKDKFENYKKPKESQIKKDNNINYKKVDYNIIINNNKTNYYVKGDKINNESAYIERKQIKNLKPSQVKEYMEKTRRIMKSNTNYMQNENKMYNNKKDEENSIQNQTGLFDKIKPKILEEIPENIERNNITEMIEDNSKKYYKNKEIPNLKLKYVADKKKLKKEEKDEINEKEIKKKKSKEEEKEKIEELKKKVQKEKKEGKENISNKKERFKEKSIKEKDSNDNQRISLKHKNNNDKKIEDMNLRRQKILMEREIILKNSKEREVFKNKISSILSKYINTDIILDTFPGGFNYLQNKFIYLDVSCSEEEFNFIYTQKNFYKSQNVKELFRKGIPLKYIKKFIKKLLNLENCRENYNFKHAMIIKELDTDYIGDYVPYYNGKIKNKFEEVLPLHYLNEEGIKQLKVTMWLISDLVPKIEYSPFLAKICSILLLFFEKEEAFEAMRTLIEMNYDPSDIYKLRWHFRYSFAENNKLVESIKIFLENQSENIKELFDIFRNKGLEPLALINEFVESLFLDFLNFYGIIRFICIFLYEGVKAFYRISFAILNYLYERNLEQIKNCKKDLKSELKMIIFNAFDYNRIFEEAFNLQLSRFNNGYINNDNGEHIEELEIPFECASKYYNENSDNDSNIDQEKQKEIEKEKLNKKKHNYIFNFYLPSIEPKSNILTSKYIFKLWPKLPKRFKHINLATIYSLSRKKVNMKSIIELCRKYPKEFKILILIETEQGELFGIILPQMLEDTGEEKYIKLEKCYLINFLPKINIYKDENEIICEKMLCCNKKGLWFCKEQVGDLLYIEGTLTEGNICKDNTYFGKINITQKGYFLIKDFEIIVFVENDM